jgi:dTDP-4-dehydrorhamnose 3,5-epimerase
MIFTQTHLSGAYIIDIEKREDSRGFFARAWCVQEFGEHGLDTNLVQANISLNLKKGTLRGMHFQRAPYEETKLVKCTKGSIYDVIVDLRPNSATYKHWIGFELTADNHRMLYVPKNFGHGFQTLNDDTEVAYLVTQFYSQPAATGVRYNDPAFNIVWPLPVTVISENDQSWPDFTP